MDQTINENNSSKYTIATGTSSCNNTSTTDSHNDIEQHFVRLDENQQQSQQQSTIRSPVTSSSSSSSQVPISTTTQNDNHHHQYRIQRGEYDNNNNNNEITIDYKNISRIIITGIAVLLIIAGVLTVISISHYKFIIGLFWIVLIGAYFGLIVIIQNAAQTGHRPFHPIVHNVADWISTECTNFINDCHNINDIVLLLKNENENTTSTITVIESESMQNDQSNTNFVSIGDLPQQQQQQQRNQNQNQPRKAKSILFRTMVQPFIGFHIKRRNKNRNRQ